jgi:hypothetical protein
MEQPTFKQNSMKISSKADGRESYLTGRRLRARSCLKGGKLARSLLWLDAAYTKNPVYILFTKGTVERKFCREEIGSIVLLAYSLTYILTYLITYIILTYSLTYLLT